MTLRVGSFGAPLSNEIKLVETVYDFTADTGAIADYTLTAGADVDLMVKLVAVKVETGVTGGVGALVTVETSATADAFLNSEPFATFAVGAVVIPENATTGGTAGFVKVAADATLQLSIEVAALTAGKLTLVWEVARF